MKEEIIAGIQNAIERGASLEQATQSFINAGYNPMEVKEAATSFTAGASEFTAHPSSLPATPAFPVDSPKFPQSYQSTKPLPKIRVASKPKKNIGIIIALSAILVLLLGGIVFILIQSGILASIGK
ncbi:MAG TPA: hypothetical protein VJK51_03195 [Candidatus Nanoarchaeia archaeon]|nr:hypothetical protein [Candidatus Nanoarchaeia archaeon]